MRVRPRVTWASDQEPSDANALVHIFIETPTASGLCAAIKVTCLGDFETTSALRPSALVVGARAHLTHNQQHLYGGNSVTVTFLSPQKIEKYSFKFHQVDKPYSSSHFLSSLSGVVFPSF